MLCTLPMTTVESERYFSTLKRIKTFLRNTMGQERLSALAMLSIENAFIKNILPTPRTDELILNINYFKFENVLENYKKNPAVGYWDVTNSYTTLSYEEINEMTKNVIEVIRNTIKEKYVCIGLYMEHTHFIPSLIVSLQKCDLAFIFLDPYVPDTNLRIIQKLQLKWIISINHENYTEFLSKYATERADFEKPNSLKLWEFVSSTETDNSFKEICCVVCSSGTTGEPKIIKVQNQCIMSNIISLRKKFEISQDDVIYFGTPLTFDPSLVELFLALTSGSTLLIVPPKIKMNSTRLLTVLFPKENIYKGVTVLQMVPSLFLRWNQVDIEFILQRTTCRILAFGGEKFPEFIIKIKRSNCLRIFNLYGITEVSCWAAVHEVKNNDEEIPLGDPLDGTILEVRNDGGSEVFDGEGELYIGSFSRICYIDQENKSSISKPVFRSTGDTVRINNKHLFYVCRKNSIIKRLGHRLNLSEVEKSVFKESNISNSCIWLENKHKLVLFIVIPEFNPVTKHKIVDKLRVKLLHTLPKQCFPDHIEIIPNLPLTRHGKIDKKSLELIYNNSVSSWDVKTPVDVFMFLWSKYLGLSLQETEKYHHSNFFEIGGNSISAIQYLSEFQEATGVDYRNDLTTLLFESTLQECCDYLNNSTVVSSKKRQHNSKEVINSKIRILEEIHAKKEQNNIRLRISWQYNLKACVDSSPTIIETRTSTLIAIGSFAHIFAVLDSTNGNIISQIVLPDTIESACCVSPIKEHLYVGCFDGKMYCIDYKLGNIIWEYSTGDRIKSTPCLCLENQSIVFGSYDKSIHCVDFENGISIWKTAVAESISSNPMSHQDKIYIATIFGTCLCLSENNGEILWKCRIGVPIFASPCVDNSNATIIWGDVSGNLHSFSCKSGKKNWIFKANGNIYSSLMKYENFVVFGCHDHNIYCVQINEDACVLNYTVQLESAMNSKPQILEYQETIYIITVTNQGTIYIIEFYTGKIIESLKLQGEVFSSPAIKNNQIYVGCRDNNLYCLSIDEVNK